MIDKKFFLGLALGYIASRSMRRNPEDEAPRRGRRTIYKQFEHDMRPFEDEKPKPRKRKKGRRTIYKQFEHDMRDAEDYLRMDREGYVHRR